MSIVCLSKADDNSMKFIGVNRNVNGFTICHWDLRGAIKARYLAGSAKKILKNAIKRFIRLSEAGATNAQLFKTGQISNRIISPDKTGSNLSPCSSLTISGIKKESETDERNASGKLCYVIHSRLSVHFYCS